MQSSFLALFLILVVTMFYIYKKLAQPRSTALGDVPLLPYSVPWFGHTFSFLADPYLFLNHVSSVGLSKPGVVAVMISQEKHNIVKSFSIAEKLLSSPDLSPTEARLHTFRTFFDDGGSTGQLKTELQNDLIKGRINGFKNELGLSASIEKLLRVLEVRTFNLISFNESWIDQSSWERAGNTTILAGLDTTSTAEVSFFSLVGSFIGEIATEILMGRNFLEKNPAILEDIKTWNSKSIPFLVGWSKWLPNMSAAATARRRVLDGVWKFQDALLKFIDLDEDPGLDWSDMSDVSQVMIDRARRYKDSKISARARISADAALLWSIQKSTGPICWLLYRIYPDYLTLEVVRKEIKAFVKVEQHNSDLPVQEPPQISINIEGLMGQCPNLKACLYRTLRLDTNTISYRRTTNDVLVTESQEDAIRFGRKEAATYKLPKGELVCMPHFAYHKDHRYWGLEFEKPNPFFTEKDTAKFTDCSERVLTFGGGPSTCPGKDFAEREIMAAAAVILTMWDVVPVGGKWDWPRQKISGTSFVPENDVRVMMSRRTSSQV